MGGPRASGVVTSDSAIGVSSSHSRVAASGLSSLSIGGSVLGFRLLKPKASYLVDPSSSHMLVSKIKPCMSKYKPLEGETAKGSLNHT